MNQILSVNNNENDNNREKVKIIRESEKNSNKIEIKKIVRTFSVFLIVFGVALISKGTYSLYKEKDSQNTQKMPKLVIGRVNDKAILNIEHLSEISRVIYSWNDGEETILPEGTKKIREEIILPNQDSTLNIIVEDMQGQKVEYNKQFLLTGKDITKPSIKIETQEGNKKMKIIATDEKEISHLSYQWEGEEIVVIEASDEGQKEIVCEVDLIPGTKNINIIAEDKNSNVEQINKKIVATTSKPRMQLLKDGPKIYFDVFDDDGIKDVKINFNGKILTAENINLKAAKIEIPEELKKGKNTIAVEVTNISGYTEKAATEIEY